MQINNVSANYNQKQCNFKALKGIKFIGYELEANYRAQNELLKIFDKKPVKDIFTKLDASIEFEAKKLEFTKEIARKLNGAFTCSSDIGISYNIVSKLNLKNNISELISQFKEMAKKEQVDIDADLNLYEKSLTEKRVDFLKGQFFLIDDYKKCESIGELDEKLEKLNNQIKENESVGDIDLGVTVFNKTCLERLKTIYQKNPEEMNNKYLFAAYDFVEQLDSINMEKYTTVVTNLFEKVKKDFNNILQEAIIKKNVETKLKELLGENYITPEKRATMNKEENFKKNIDKSAFETQDKTEEKVSNAKRKTRKPKTKKTDAE